MVKLVALYTAPPDPDAFDRHYRETHLPLIERWPGLRRLEAGKVTGAVGGPAPYYLVAEMYFDDADTLRAALRSAEGRAAGDDLQTFAKGLVTMMYVLVS